MGSFNRDGRSGESRGGFQSRGRSSFGGGRSFGSNDRGSFQPRGRSSFGNDRGPREMFKAVCDNCGKDCEVPFRPTSGKPVYCSDCFEKMGGRESSERPQRSERSDSRPQAPRFDQDKSQFDALNAKLDKILRLLEPEVKKTVVSEPIVEVAEEVKAPKVSKSLSVREKKVKKVASEK